MPPLDPSIILGLKPYQQPDQLGMLAQVMQIKHAQDQGRLADLQYQQNQQLFPLQIKEHEAKIAQAAQEAKFNEQIMGGGGLGALQAMSADQADAVALRAIAMKHQGALGFAKLAEQKRADETQRAGMVSMRSQGGKTIMPDPQEAQQSADQGTPTVDPVTVPGSGGALSFLVNSPYVGPAAKQYQTQIDAGAVRDPNIAQKHIENLLAMHGSRERAQAAIDAASARQDKAALHKFSFRMEYPPAGRGSGNAETTSGDFTKTGEEFLQTIPLRDRALVKKLGDYEQDPKTLSVRGGHREEMLKLATQYNPQYDDTQYANKRRAIAQFGSGPIGSTVRSITVAVEHIDTLKRAADALKNGSFTPGNKVWNETAKVLGQAPPNTFEALRDIVANEVVKGTIGTAGAMEDRKQASEKIKAQSSPEQLTGLFNGWTELMGGQVKGLERQYQGATGLKDFRTRYLTPRAQEAIALAESKANPQRRASDSAPRIRFDAQGNQVP